MHKWIVITNFRLKEYNFYDFVIFLNTFLDYIVAQQENIRHIVEVVSKLFYLCILMWPWTVL